MGINILSERLMWQGMIAIPDSMFSAIFILMFITALVAIILFSSSKCKQIVPTCFMVAFILLALSCVFVAPISQASKKEIKCTISNKYIVEFYDKYEIVDKEGDIFTIRER